MAEVKLTIRTNLTKAAHEIENFGRVTKEEQTRINAFAAKFKGENIEKFIKKFERTAIAARAVGGELGDLKSRQVQLRAEIRRLIKSGMDPQDKSLKSLVNAYQSAGRELETYNRQLRKQQFLQNAAKNSAAKMGRAMLMVGGAASAGVVAGLGLAARQYAQFDDALVSASAKWGMAARRGTQTFEQLKQLSRQIGATTEFTATQAAKGLDYLAMAGFKTKTSMALLPKVVNLATAANIDLARASDIASDSLGAFGMMSKNAAQNAKNLERISDVMAKTAAMANTDLPTMFEAVKKGAAQFNAAGQSVETFSAMLAVLANSSVKGEEAGTQLRNMMLRLANPTAKARKIMRQLNITTADSNGNFKDAIKIISQFEKSLKTMGNKQRSAALDTLFGSRSITGMNILLEAGSEALEEYRDRLYAAGGAADEMSGIMRSSLGNQFKTLQSTVSDVGWQIMEALNTRLRGGLSSLTAMIRKIDVGFVVTQLNRLGNVVKFLWRNIKIIIPLLGGLTTTIIAYKVAAKGAALVSIMLQTAMNPAYAIAFSAAIATAVGVVGGFSIAIQNARDTAGELQDKMGEVGPKFRLMGEQAEQTQKKIKKLTPELEEFQKKFGNLDEKKMQKSKKVMQEQIEILERNKNSLRYLGKSSLHFIKANENVEKALQKLYLIEESLEKIRAINAEKGSKRLAAAKAEHNKFVSSRSAINQKAANEIKILQQKEALGLIKNEELQKRSLAAYKRAAEQMITFLVETNENNAVTKRMIQQNIAKVRELEAAMRAAATVPLQEKLAILHNAAAQAEQKRLGTYNQFLEARMKQDKVFGSTRLAWLQEEKTRIMALENLTYAERKAANIAFEDSILAVKREKAKEAIGIATHYSSQAMGIFSGLSQIASNISQAEMAEEQLLAEGRMQRLDEQAENNIARLEAELDAKKITQEQYDRQKENYEKERDKKKAKIEAEMEKKRRQGQREAAIRSKFIQVAQASINTALAVTNALATTQPFIPNAVIAAATAAAAGAAQIGVAASTPIPAAETGGRFVVPPAPGRPSRADNIGLRVNEGEVIDVTPRGESAGRSITVQVNIDSEVLLKHVQEGFDSGRLVVNQNNIA